MSTDKNEYATIAIDINRLRRPHTPNTDNNSDEQNKQKLFDE